MWFTHYGYRPGVLVVSDSDPTWSFRQVNHFSKFLDLVQHIIEEKKRILDVFAIVSVEIDFQVEDKYFLSFFG